MDGYRITAATNPFRVETVHADIDSGTRLIDALGGNARVHCEIDGHPTTDLEQIPPDGANVAIRALPGGSDTGIVAAQIALIALSIWVPGALALTGVARAIASAAIMAAGSSLLNRQQATDTPDPLTSNPLHSLSGARNQTLHYGAVPIVYGRHRMFPPVAGRAYTEAEGGDQYLRILFAIGLGNPHVEDIRIGETPIGEFEGAEYQIGTAPSLYPRSIIEEGLGVQFEQTDTHDGSSHTRTTAPAHEISLDITFPTGISYRNKEGDRKKGFAYFLVEYREEGATTWLNACEAVGATTTGPTSITQSLPDAAFYPERMLLAQSKSADPQRISIRWKAHTPGKRYDVRISKGSIGHAEYWGGPAAEPLSKFGAMPIWSALRAVEGAEPADIPGVTMLAIRVKATSQLTGVIDALNCIVFQRTRIYTPGTGWSAPLLHRNPAWAYVDVLTGPGNATPVSEGDLDLDAFAAWAIDCGQRKLTYDSVIDTQRPVIEVLREIAAAGLATWAIRDGIYTVVRDVQQSTPVQTFTPRNSFDFSSTKAFPEFPHALRARYVNADAGWQEDEILVADDGYTAETASVIESITIPGVTNADTVWKLARYQIADMRLRPERYSLSTDLEHLVATRGDLVRVAHDIPMWGGGYGRLRQVNGDFLTLDDPVIVEPAKTYVVRVRRADGSSHYSAVSASIGADIDLLQMLTSVPGGEEPVAAGDLYLFGELGSDSVELLITEVAPLENLGARLTLVDAAPEIYEADTGTIPDFDTQITTPPNLQNIIPDVPLIVAVESGESVMVRAPSGLATPRILVSFILPSSYTTAGLDLEVRHRLADSSDVFVPHPAIDASSGFVTVAGVETGEQYEVQLRTRTPWGTKSPWTWITHTVVGGAAPPPNVPWAILNGETLSFGLVDVVDLAGYRVRMHYGGATNWGTAADILTGLVLSSPHQFEALPGGDITLLVCAVDQSGNVSPSPATVSTFHVGQVVENVVEQQAEADLFWPGSITGGTVDATLNAVVADETSLMWSGDDDLMWSDSSESVDLSGEGFFSDSEFFSDFASSGGSAPMWDTPKYAPMQYKTTFAPPATAVGSPLSVEVVVFGEAVRIEYRTNDAMMWSDDENALMWDADPDSYMWTAAPFLPWLGRLDECPETLEFCISTGGGPVQGILTRATFTVDVPDRSSRTSGYDIPARGARIPLGTAFQAITNVQVTVIQDSGSDAVGARIIDQDPILGPLIEVIDTTGAAVAGKANILIQGY